MNELIIDPAGAITRVLGGDANGIALARGGKRIEADELDSDPWRLIGARADRKVALVGVKNGTHKGGLRDQQFREWDKAALIAWENGDAPGEVKAKKQALRDLPPVIDAALARLVSVDDINNYMPDELK